MSVSSVISFGFIEVIAAAVHFGQKVEASGFSYLRRYVTFFAISNSDSLLSSSRYYLLTT